MAKCFFVLFFSFLLSHNICACGEHKMLVTLALTIMDGVSVTKQSN